jgi:hypothetical protein
MPVTDNLFARLCRIRDDLDPPLPQYTAAPNSTSARYSWIVSDLPSMRITVIFAQPPLVRT